MNSGQLKRMLGWQRPRMICSAPRCWQGQGTEQTRFIIANKPAEKALKAFLTWHDRPFRKTHNLLELGDACAAIDPTIAVTAARVHVLTDDAWKLRYPGDPYVLEEGNWRL